MLAVQTSPSTPTPREAARDLLVQALHDANRLGAIDELHDALGAALRMLTAGPEDACLSLAAQVLSAAKLVSRHGAPAGRVRLVAQVAIEALHLECAAPASARASRESAIASFDMSVHSLVVELEALDAPHDLLVRMSQLGEAARSAASRRATGSPYCYCEECNPVPVPGGAR